MESKFILESVEQKREPNFRIFAHIEDERIVKTKKKTGEFLEIKLCFNSDGDTSTFTDAEISSLIWNLIDEIKKPTD